jgi:hypothetical protein
VSRRLENHVVWPVLIPPIAPGRGCVEGMHCIIRIGHDVQGIGDN